MLPWVRLSPLLSAHGLRHGFCVSGRPADAEAAHAIAPNASLALARQVHGSAVARAGWAGGCQPEADAVFSANAAYACAVRTADCAPVLMACTRTGAVAAIHAGWRGLAAGVIAQCMARMASSSGADPAWCVAAIGPCARACHYEVGEEVAEAMDRAGCGGAVTRRLGAPRPFLDVAAAARIQLLSLGLAESSIDGDAPCSIESLWCPSHRRAPTDGSRMLSLIAARPA